MKIRTDTAGIPFVWGRRAILLGLLAGWIAASPAAAAVMAEEALGQEALSELPTGDISIRISPENLKKISEEESASINEKMADAQEEDASLLVNRAEHYYYYEHLDLTAKGIYDVMLDLVKHPTQEEYYGFMMTDMDPESDAYYYEMLEAYYAMTYDHPELFWLYGASETTINYYSEAKSVGGIYYVYYRLVRPYVNYQAQMTAFNEAAEAFLGDIDTDVSEYEMVRQIHDKLIELVQYDDSVQEDLQGQAQNLAHTAYGALVENSAGEAHTAVCDGYALAFEYLLQQRGIEAVVVAGDAGADETGAGAHAWNLVKLDGAWYEVDVTWNDAGTRDASLPPGIQGYDYYLEALHDPQYRSILQHCHFLMSTEQMRSFLTGAKYGYQTSDNAYTINLVGDSVHIRFRSNGTQDPGNADASVISAAPIAEEPYD